MLSKVSLIIPHKDSLKQLNNLLDLMKAWTIYPDEILVVDSSKEKLNISKELLKFFDENKISLQLILGEKLFPGKARNLAILAAKNPIIAFLDVGTVPTSQWLETSLAILEDEDIEGVWGMTKYQANTFTEKLIRASTYGSLPIRTLPGSVFHKNIFHRCGLFIESVRAGEDGDWVSRLKLHRVLMGYPKEELSYIGLSGISYLSVIKKWHRNYLSSAILPSMKAHKDFYFYAIAFFLVAVAFNWNWIMSNWDPESIFYIPNVTKISIGSIWMTYFIYRGLVIPIKKGINYRFLFPINFILILLLSLILDLDKSFAFAQAKFREWRK